MQISGTLGKKGGGVFMLTSSWQCTVAHTHTHTQAHVQACGRKDGRMDGWVKGLREGYKRRVDGRLMKMKERGTVYLGVLRGRNCISTNDAKYRILEQI